MCRSHAAEVRASPGRSGSYWSFEVEGVAQRCLYIDYLLDTWTLWDVDRAINNFPYTIEPRPWQDIPI